MPQMSCPGGLLGHARSTQTLPPSVLGEGTEMTPDERSRRRDFSCLPLPVTPGARLCVRSRKRIKFSLRQTTMKAHRLPRFLQELLRTRKMGAM